jgi:sulfite reductase (NADPH) flavoprotein alpha-component
MTNTVSATTQPYTKENPLETELLENKKLNKKGSAKDTRHFTINLKSSNLVYEPGDSLYVYPENEENLVSKLIGLITNNLPKDQEFIRFSKEVNITRPSNKLFKLLEEKSSNKLDSKTLSERFIGYSIPTIIEVLIKENPELELTSNEIVDNSSKLQARAYSIASSLKAHPEEVHLCIARVDEEINGQKVLGVCSNYLSDRVKLKEKNLRIYLHSNDKFRLPEDSTKDIIMVGPGTGIAPFRAFIEERNYLRDNGKTVGQDWLFFGDQRKDYDYIYGEELEAYNKTYGLKITTAFSRDQTEKVYVQHKMKEHSKEIFQMLENGAYFYVCGDARRMAKDVDEVLRAIIEEHGKDSNEYINKLKDEKRYSRDVY